MIEPTYNIVSGQNLLDSYKIHYDFNNYTAAGGENFIDDSADSFFSGHVHAINQSFEPTDPFDYFTGNGWITGQGIFSGGLNQYYDFITIQNHTGLHTGVNGEFTFLIAAEITNKQDYPEADSYIKGPFKNNNILFSNLSGSGNCYNGWQFGINASNRAYFEVYNKLQPTTLTYLNPKMPFSHNIWGFMYRGGQIRVGLYDIKDEEFNFDAAPVQLSNLQSGSFWNIGSGLNYNPQTFTAETLLNSGVFMGRMSNFVYFDKGISDKQAARVAGSLYGEAYSTSSATSENIIAGFTGFSTSSSNLNTEVGVSTSNSAFNEVGNFSFEEKVTLSGTVNSGDTHYVFVKRIPHEISGTQDIYKTVYHTGTPITSATGFSLITHSSGAAVSVDSFTSSSSNGNLLTGLSYNNETGLTSTLSLSSSTSGVSGAAPNLFRPNEFSYIDSDTGYVAEIHRADDFEINNKWSLNNIAHQGYSTFNNGRTVYLNHMTGAETVTLYVDGRAYELGGAVLNNNVSSEIVVNSISGKTYVITCSGVFDIDNYDESSTEITTYFNSYNITGGDFSLSGREILDAHVWTGVRGDNLKGIYDLNQPTGYLTGVSRWVITDTSQYELPDSDFDANDQQQLLFLNGQKLVSGLDYGDAFASSSWSDYVSGTTGVLFLRPNISSHSYTGFSGNLNDIYYWPNSNMVYFDGIRQNVKNSFVEHSASKDLISGVKTIAKNTRTLYNN